MPPARPIIATTTLVMAVVVWLALVLTIATMNESDAAGNGMSFGYAIIMSLVLWGLLGVLVPITAFQVITDSWGRVAALVLLPVSLAAAIATINLLSGNSAVGMRFAILVPALAPLLILGFCVCALVPSLRATISVPRFGRTTWTAVILLSLVPWPLLLLKARNLAARSANPGIAQQLQEQTAHDQLEAQFDSLTTTSPLRDWLAFATAGHALRERTLEGIRQLPKRQAEAEAMRAPDLAMLMYELRNLALDATPALCATTTAFLVEHAETFRERAASTLRYELVGDSMERYELAMQWLSGKRCNIASATSAYTSVAQLYAAAPDRDRFLNRLDQLRSNVP